MLARIHREREDTTCCFLPVLCSGLFLVSSSTTRRRFFSPLTCHSTIKRAVIYIYIYMQTKVRQAHRSTCTCIQGKGMGEGARTEKMRLCPVFPFVHSSASSFSPSSSCFSCYSIVLCGRHAAGKQVGEKRKSGAGGGGGRTSIRVDNNKPKQCIQL